MIFHSLCHAANDTNFQIASHRASHKDLQQMHFVQRNDRQLENARHPELETICTCPGKDALLPIIGIESSVGETLQCQLLLGKTPPASRVGTAHNLLNECHVVFATGEVATAAK